MNNNQQENEEYISMINYLISNLNKAKINPPSAQQKKASMPVFLFEFFVFELYLPRDIIRNVKQPIIACRLLDFPTLTLEGRVNLQNETIIFNQGKSSFFEMDIGQLKNSLINQSMYIMLLDLNHGNMNIIGSCRLNISVFAYESFLNYDRNSKGPDPRRNILQLFDNTPAKIGEFEISLLIRREYYKFDKNVEINENDKTVLIKKLKKKKENYTKHKNEQIYLRAEEKPKEKYIQKEVKQPQYFNNFVFERNDSAFNAHPVNKVVVVRSQSQTHISNQSQPQSGNKKKRKKSKNSIKGIQTEEIPGVNVPINCFDYRKGKSQTKKRNNINNSGGQNSYLNNIYYNNPQFMQTNYSNGQNNQQYYMTSSSPNSFQYYNNSNNNFYNPKTFNNNNYYHQNINNNIPFYQTNGNYYMNNQNQNQINNRQMNNDNLNETNKSKTEPNEYLRLLSEIKNKVSTYKDKLSNEQINIKKVKQQRNINNSLNITNQNLDNTNNNNNNDDDNQSNNDNNEEINNNNKFNNIQNNKNDSLNNNDINNNVDIKPENIDSVEEEYKSEFIQNITESESNPAKNSSDNFISNSQNLKKDEKKAIDKDMENKIENPIKEEDDDYDDFEQNDNNKKEEEENKELYNDFEPNNNVKKDEEEEEEDYDFDINKEDTNNELKTKENPTSTNKFNTYNIDVINESNNEIEESIKDENDVKNKGDFINAESQSNKDKNPSIKYNSLENNEVKESNIKISSNQNTMNKEGRSTSENLASSGKKSIDTNDLEDLLK